MPTVRVHDQLTLAALASAVSTSRVFAKITLTKWGATRILDDALLTTSELVTNAVKATGSIDPKPGLSTLESLNVITVRLVGVKDAVYVEVWDASPEAPTIKAPGLDDEGGRGLGLVDRLARRWGTYSCVVGKVVWAELALYPNHTRS